MMQRFFRQPLVRRWRGLVALLLLLPMATANAALCALCAARHAHMGSAMMEMEDDGGSPLSAPTSRQNHYGCGRQISDGSCPGHQIFASDAFPTALLQVPFTVVGSRFAPRERPPELRSLSLPPQTPPPRA